MDRLAGRRADFWIPRIFVDVEAGTVTDQGGRKKATDQNHGQQTEKSGAQPFHQWHLTMRQP
jgi:hypothetical protein